MAPAAPGQDDDGNFEDVWNAPLSGRTRRSQAVPGSAGRDRASQPPEAAPSHRGHLVRISEYPTSESVLRTYLNTWGSSSTTRIRSDSVGASSEAGGTESGKTAEPLSLSSTVGIVNVNRVPRPCPSLSAPYAAPVRLHYPSADGQPKPHIPLPARPCRRHRSERTF